MTLEHALVREVRHYEETRLLEVTCGACERRFFAIQVEAIFDPLKTEDVERAADQLAWARSLCVVSTGLLRTIPPPPRGENSSHPSHTVAPLRWRPIARAE